MNLANQILALDARYNNYRVPNDPQFKTLYLRRRSQLLTENAKKEQAVPNTRGQYLALRKQLLAKKYNLVVFSDSSRGGSRQSRNSSFAASYDSLHFDPSKAENIKRTHRRYNSSSASYLGSGSSFNFLKYTDNKYSDNSASTMATASKAMAGNTTLSENYAFSGMFHIFDQHAKDVSAIKFAQNDRFRLACSSLDSTLSICNLGTSPPEVTCTLRGHTKGVTDFDWSLSNDFLLSSSHDCTARVWDSSSGRNIRVIKDTYASPVLACRFVPLNNNMITTGNEKGHIQIYNMSTGKCTKGGAAKCTAAVLSLEFDSSSTSLWGGDEKGCLHSFSLNLMSGKIQRERRIVLSEHSPITSLSYRAWISREAREPMLLVNCACNELFLFKISSNDGELTVRNTFPIKHSKLGIRSSFCPLMSLRDGACVGIGYQGLSAASCYCIHLPVIPRVEVGAATENALSPYDFILVDGTVNKLPDDDLRHLLGQYSTSSSLTGGEDMTVSFFNVESPSKTRVNQLMGHSAPVLDVCWNYDESLLASCDTDGTVIVWKREGKS